MLPLRWTLHVENFGRIKSADIQIAPMMIFVGQNNTGKSYLASLLWGILSLSPKILLQEIPSTETYKKCKESLISHYEDKKNELDKELIKSVFLCLNEFFKEKKNEFIREIFTSNDLEIGDLSIEIKDKDIPKLSTEWYESAKFAGFDLKNYKASIIYNPYLIVTDDNLDSLYGSIHQFLTKTLLVGRNISSLYLPASGTGFMLSYKSLISNLMETWGLDKEAKSDFPKPIIHFLQKLMKADISVSKHKYYDIGNSLEKEILEGRIEQAPRPTVGFYYKPELSKKSLPFHLTSSLVSELAPLIIFLKGSDINTLIFEEPESHLHLNAQRILAKYLVKLVNNDMPVWMTTHSDIFFQQINNLMATNEERIKKLRELSYQDDEMIAPNNINAYQFNLNKDGMTEVVPLEKTEDGFIVPTFNQAVKELSQETIKLETEIEDAEREV